MDKLIRSLVVSLVFASSAVFAEKAYVESDGSQVVSTGYCLSPDSKVEIEFQIKDKSMRGVAVGASWMGTGTPLGLWINGNGNLEPHMGGWLGGAIGANDIKENFSYRAVFDAPNKIVQIFDAETGKLLATKNDASKMTGLSGTASIPFCLFGIQQTSGRPTYFSKARIYSCKIYASGELIHDYVPCVKGDSVGFYDTEDNRFYGRFSGNPFASGGDIMAIEDEAYVEFDGTDYIQTNYMPQPDTRIELDFLLTDATVQQFLVEAGSDKANDLQVRIYLNSSGGYSWSFSDKDNYTTFPNDGSQIPVVVGCRQRAIVDGSANKTILQADGVTLSEKDMTTVHTVPSVSAKLRLFHNRFDKRYTKGRIYGFKISEGGVLKQDYVAVKEHGVAFLRDRITGQTLHPTAREPYVASSGNQMVVLDYKPNAKTVIEVECSHLTKADYNKYIFGVDSGANALYAWLNNNSTDAGVEFKTHNCFSWRQVTGDENLAAHKSLIVDVPKSLVTVRLDESRFANADISTRDNYVAEVGESAYPIALFNVNAATPGVGKGVSGRIYRVTVKEDGEVIRLYEPYVKEGVVGFRDTMTGGFFAGLLNSGKTQVNALRSGGAIAYEGEVPEAYIEGDQTQYILTDYVPTKSTRVEIDFQLTKIRNDFYLFGSNTTPYWDLYVNGSYGFTTICHTSWNTQTTEEQWANLERTKMVIDRARGKWSIYRGEISREDYKTYGEASATVATVPFGIFARQEAGGAHYPDAGTSGINGTVPMRVYSFRVYEGSELKHEFLPYKNGDTNGLMDTVSGKVYTSNEGNPFVVNGVGYQTAAGEKATFVTPLVEKATVGRDGTVTFGPVYAPGAIRYEWTRGGELLATTGDSVTLDWQRVSGDHTQAVSVTPIYEVYGREVKGEPSKATLTNEPKGLSILIR